MRPPKRSRATNLPSLTARRPKVLSAMPRLRQKFEISRSRLSLLSGEAVVTLVASAANLSLVFMRTRTIAEFFVPLQVWDEEWDSSHRFGARLAIVEFSLRHDTDGSSEPDCARDQ